MKLSAILTLICLNFLPGLSLAEEVDIKGEFYTIIPLDEYMAVNPELENEIDPNSYRDEKIIGFAESQAKTGWLTNKITFICYTSQCNPTGDTLITINSKKFKYMVEVDDLDDWEYQIRVLSRSLATKKVSPLVLEEERSEQDIN